MPQAKGRCAKQSAVATAQTVSHYNIRCRSQAARPAGRRALKSVSLTTAKKDVVFVLHVVVVSASLLRAFLRASVYARSLSLSTRGPGVSLSPAETQEAGRASIVAATERKYYRAPPLRWLLLLLPKSETRWDIDLELSPSPFRRIRSKPSDY